MARSVLAHLASGAALTRAEVPDFGDGAEAEARTPARGESDGADTNASEGAE